MVFLGAVVVGFACAGLAARARAQEGIAIGFGASVGVALVFGVVWIGASYLKPHPDEVHRTAIVPGGILDGDGMALLQVVTANWIGPKLQHESALYGSLAVSFVVLGWLYVVGRLLVAAPLLNSAVHEHRKLGFRSETRKDSADEPSGEPTDHTESAIAGMSEGTR